MKNLNFTGKDGLNIAYYLWDEVDAPKGIVQIAHGMAEYAARYDDFAKYLNSKGYIVAGDDHRGHGLTVGIENRGITSGDSYFDTIEDMHILNNLLSEQYKLPIILLGHSYGSFLSQGYIEKYSDEIKGCILSGTAYMNNGLVAAGRAIAKLQTSLFGEQKPAKLINTLSFGGYDKPFKSEKQPFAWLSRDLEQVKKYCADDFCGYVMCLGFQKHFFCGLKKIYEQQALEGIRKDLPILVTAGDSDPVGQQGELVKELYEVYRSIGITNIAIKLYEGARHEILNETNKAEVYENMLTFIDSNI